ncbi:hypothetical protein [Dryocola sp. BD626]|uniref:hypothetical protein n=1 Tax=Dryocola sp. BD626 TaxID=3133273 RepID=UPI003F4FACCB
MPRKAISLFLPVLAALFLVTGSLNAAQSKDDIRQQIIDASIESYPGNCPCPYNSMRNGRQCGGRSAWSKEGGYSPICYKKEVTEEMIEEWRAEHDS